MGEIKLQVLEQPLIEWMENGDEFEWEYLTDELTELMNKISKQYRHEGYWHAEVTGFGWRSLDGYKNFKAETGTEFLREILPNTDCHFRIFKDGKTGFRIQNYHHDAPTGKEWYTVRHMNMKEAEEYIYG